jgi:hypothetical protein
MSYTKWLNNNNLYPSDYYIQHIIQRIPNERYFLASLLSLSGKYLEIFTFLIHALSSIALIYGLFLIGKKFLTNEKTIWLFIFLLLFPFYKFNLGGNDIYYNSINIAKACSIWVIYMALEKRFYLVVGLAVLATLLHPMAGFQISVLCFGSYLVFFIKHFIEKKILSEEKYTIKKYFISLTIYLIFATLWIGSMFLGFAKSDLSPTLFAEIINFRLPHHFVPTSFGLKNYIILAPLFLFAWFYFYKRNDILFYFFSISICGLIIYCILLLGFHQYDIISSQWFKTTVWLKPLAIIAILAYLEEKNYISFIQKIPVFVYGILVILLSLLKSNDYHFPMISYKNAEIEIAILAEAKTPQNAVFVTPASCTFFKYYSERSSYIDFKAVTHSKDALGEWYSRIKEVYHLENTTEKGLNLTSIADQNFSQCTKNDFMALQNKGVSHLLCSKNQVLELPIIAENQDFIIYELR